MSKRNIALIMLLILSFLYFIPNFFGEVPSIEISLKNKELRISNENISKIKNIFEKEDINGIKDIEFSNKKIVVKFNTSENQIIAKEKFSKIFDDNFIVALNLNEMTPKILKSIGAHPMKLGLDLRGGVHFLFHVDTDSIIKKIKSHCIYEISSLLEKNNIKSSEVNILQASEPEEAIDIYFIDKNINLEKIFKKLKNNNIDFNWVIKNTNKGCSIHAILNNQNIKKIKQNTIEQTISVLRHRVDELGIGEAIVQQEGLNGVSVDLPGIQDPAQAKNIIGKTATVEFYFVKSYPIYKLLNNKNFYSFFGKNVLLEENIILSGESIYYAMATHDQNTSRPAVAIKIGPDVSSKFYEITKNNVGRQIATVYKESLSNSSEKNYFGNNEPTKNEIKKIINIARIQSPLGNQFQITGLSVSEAKDLSILLRSGSFPTSVSTIEEKVIGPSMGENNIKMGILSILIGMIFIILFMSIYYKLFGLISIIGLFINIILLIAALSILGATLTFSGIAGIVLTLGMAIDANVLIYERIKEELKNGSSVQLAIYLGYERAFTTIIDANATTLLVGISLFIITSGAIKGFAIVLIIGLFTSILSSVVYTRAIINFLYRNKFGKKTISI